MRRISKKISLQFKKIFKAKRIGTVTSATFQPLTVPSTYKGKSKNKKQLYSAYVYVKWSDTTTFQEKVLNGNKETARICLDETKGTYWIVRPNTMVSDELYYERLEISELKETATNVSFSFLDDIDELVLCDLEEIAMDVALKALD